AVVKGTETIPTWCNCRKAHRNGLASRITTRRVYRVLKKFLPVAKEGDTYRSLGLTNSFNGNCDRGLRVRFPCAEPHDNDRQKDRAHPDKSSKTRPPQQTAAYVIYS